MKSSNNKIIFRLLILAFVLIVVGFLIFNKYGILTYYTLNSEVTELKHQIEDSEKEIKALAAEIDSLLNNDFKIEEVARQKFYMLKPNEQVIKIEPERFEQ